MSVTFDWLIETMLTQHGILLQHGFHRPDLNFSDSLDSLTACNFYFTLYSRTISQSTKNKNMSMGSSVSTLQPMGSTNGS